MRKSMRVGGGRLVCHVVSSPFVGISHGTSESRTSRHVCIMCWSCAWSVHAAFDLVCVRGVVILSSIGVGAAQLWGVGTCVTVEVNVRPSRCDWLFEIRHFLRPQISLRLSVYLTGTYFRETPVCLQAAWRRCE